MMDIIAAHCYECSRAQGEFVNATIWFGVAVLIIFLLACIVVGYIRYVGKQKDMSERL